MPFLRKKGIAAKAAPTGTGTLFLQGGGEMGERIRDFPWAQTPIGSPELWPQSLRTAVRLMLTSRHPMFIWWGEELIQFYNDAYRETMGPERHPSALGQRGRECWEEIWDIIGPQIEMVMRGEGATWHEDQLVPVTRHGTRQDVWWTYGYSPIDDEGGVGGVLVVCRDVTKEHLARENLAKRNRMLQGDIDRLKGLFVQAPGFMAVLEGPSHVFAFTNAAYRELIAREDVEGKPVVEALPEIAEQGFLKLLDEVYASGEPHVGTAAPVTLNRGKDGAEQLYYLDFIYQPIFDADGAVSAIFVEGYDVTSRVAEEERRNLLVREMNHRVKNILSTVQSLAMLSGRSATSVEEFNKTFSDRIQAMVQTQSLLIDGPEDRVDVGEIIRSELAPYLDGGDQVCLECGVVRMDPKRAVSLGLLVHELATNAAKYGGLSQPEGRVVVTCRVEDGRGLVDWRETTPGGAQAPETPGFGTRLIGLLAKDLNGAIEMKFHPDGLAARLEIDLAGRG